MVKKYIYASLKLTDYILLSLRAIRSNILRTILTVLIIGFGITALVGILTALNALGSFLSTNFTYLGANTFSIERLRDNGENNYIATLDMEQAENFKSRYKFPALVSISAFQNFNSVARYNKLETNPNVQIQGIDENYLSTRSIELAQGRNFTVSEIDNASHLCIAGMDIVKKIFPDEDSVAGKYILIDNRQYKVIGVMMSKGQSFVTSDNQILISYKNGVNYYPYDGKEYDINVQVINNEDLQSAIDEANGLMRSIRQLKPGQVSDFEMIKSDKIVEQLKESLYFVGAAGVIIAVLTLIGASIGLMNIMLVSVNERTREIGVLKAIGANFRSVFLQFLFEAILICIIGDILGTILGLGVGLSVAIALKAKFVFPWVWVVVAFIACTIVGLVSGVYPAFRAGRLNAVEALRAD